MAVPQLSFLRSRLCCKDLGSNGLNNKHSLEQRLWHLSLIQLQHSVVPLTVATPEVATKDRRGTGTISYHWPWNLKSTMRKDRSSPKQKKPGSSRENGWPPTTLQLHFFALRNLYLGPFETMVAGGSPKVVILAQPPLLSRSELKWAK